MTLPTQARAKTIQNFFAFRRPARHSPGRNHNAHCPAHRGPQKLLKGFLAKPESSGGAVYFLFGEGEESAKPQFCTLSAFAFSGPKKPAATFSRTTRTETT